MLAVEFACTGQVAPERLFDHDACPGPLDITAYEVRRIQTGYNRRKNSGARAR